MTETKLQPKSRGLDMLHGSIADKLFYFAMPIGLMGLFEQLFNSADVFLLGHFVGKDAMAAVGNNMPVIGLLVTLLIGISLGANVVIAQYLGAGKQDKVEETVQTAIVMALGLGVLLAAVGELIASPALKLLAVPPEVHDLAATYLRIFLLGMPFLTLYNFEAAIFRSCGDGKTPLYSLVAANILNITLDLLSVTVLGWGLTGVVSATVLSFAVNSGILFVLLCRTPQPIRLQRHHMRLNGHEMGKILHIGLPAGIQGMVFALSNVVIQSSINSLGTAAMAAAAASVIIEFNIYCFVNGFSQATTTFVGQNYGARKLSRCLASTKAAFWVEGLFLLCITLPILFFGEHIIGFFNHDPEVIQLGMLRLWCVGDMLYLNGVVDIMSGALRGYGYSLPPAIVALIGICGVRLVWIYTVFVNHRDYLTLIMAYPVSWLATTVVLAAVYYQCRKYILNSALAGK
ncbi:MATE family efflux transporter [Acidaminococcus fermentans]|uniref:MATE family efflux transporter n=1 Tax=Acidaminococcus fermentans TaxID=905 RepID=UPI00242AAA75|nr:MATE family efflux transporter [Acidaminococcus fermentans]MCI6286692.1 MATE family efflux transporter [Acidaminococcus fermentans]MDY2853363.1 MATE family efflux transporter [Acidaminococcus fermentans]